MSSHFVMASCGCGNGGGGINSYGSIRYGGRFGRALIVFRITHWMFARFQCICWCAIRCLYRRRSIRMIVMIWITIFQWMCNLRIGWNRLTLFIILNDLFKKRQIEMISYIRINPTSSDFCIHSLDICLLLHYSMNHTSGRV